MGIDRESAARGRKNTQKRGFKRGGEKGAAQVLECSANISRNLQSLLVARQIKLSLSAINAD